MKDEICGTIWSMPDEPPAALPLRSRRGERSRGLNPLLADMLAVYAMAKDFHWQVSGSHLRNYHLLRDDRARPVLATIDVFVGAVEGSAGEVHRSIAHLVRLRRLHHAGAADRDGADTGPAHRDADGNLTARLRATHTRCRDVGKIVSASLVELWTDEGDVRRWARSETAGPHGI